MFFIGSIIIWSTIINTVIIGYTDYGSQWYFDWSYIFIFVGVLLCLSSMWQDPRIVFVISGIVTLLWYLFIIQGYTL